MMLAPSNKDTRPIRKEATHAGCGVSITPAAATTIVDFDPFAMKESNTPRTTARKKESSKPERKESRSKRSSLSRPASAGRRKTPESKSKESSNASDARRSAKNISLDIQSEHVPKRGDVERIKEKRRAVSSRNLVRSNKHDRTSSVRRSQTKTGPSSEAAFRKDKMKEQSRSRNLKISRTKTLPNNPAAWGDVTDNARPELKRSNSLDSRLEDLGKETKKKKKITGKKSKNRNILTRKKSVSKRSSDTKESGKDNLQDFDSAIEGKRCASTTKRSLQFHRSKSTVEHQSDLGNTWKQSRPVLARSNSLDSKLEDLDTENDEGICDAMKPETTALRSSLTIKRGSSSRRSLVNKDSLTLKTERETLLKRERSRIKGKISLEETLVSNPQKEISAYPLPKSLSRRSCGGDHLDVDHEGRISVTNNTVANQSISRKSSCRRSTIAGKNEALKKFMQRTVKEEAAAENLRAAKLEKMSDLKIKFESITREQTKITGAAVSRQSALSVVPKGAFSQAASLALNGNPLALGAHGSTTSGNKPKLSRADSQTADSNSAAEFSVSVLDVANRMKQLGTSFRLSKNQVIDTSQSSQYRLPTHTKSTRGALSA